MGETNWIPALVALGIGVLGGLFFVFRMRPSRVESPAATGSGPLELEDRIERLRLLADDDSPAAAARRRELEIEAATLLRSIEGASVTTQAPASPQATDSRRPLRVLLWITGCSLAAAVIYFLLLQSLQTREQGAPLTGDQTLAAAPPSAAENALRARIAADPDDLDARLALARMMLDQDRLMEVHELVQSVLERDPRNALAMAYESMVLLAIGRDGDAEALLKRALELEPTLLEGWMHLGLVHFRQGDLEKALGDLEKAKEISPSDARMIDALAAEMRRAAGAEPAATESPRYAGTIRVPAAALQKYRGSLLFVIVRPAGVDGGPPTAVKRLQLDGEAVAFSIGPADSMTGAPLPAQATIEARIDEDGNAMTRGGEPSAIVPAREGSLDITLSLQ